MQPSVLNESICTQDNSGLPPTPPCSRILVQPQGQQSSREHWNYPLSIRIFIAGWPFCVSLPWFCLMSLSSLGRWWWKWLIFEHFLCSRHDPHNSSIKSVLLLTPFSSEQLRQRLRYRRNVVSGWVKIWSIEYCSPYTGPPPKKWPLRNSFLFLLPIPSNLRSLTISTMASIDFKEKFCRILCGDLKSHM